ncbi:MAG: MFS transporter [Theionarchaea archaeon]|nr:MFS transporter [Theionarchaea archaeon]MBU7037018.1 MFS transporter [Theionarchaea archaeon]
MSLYTRSFLALLVSISLCFSSFYVLLPTLPLYVQHIGGTQKEAGIIIGILTLSAVLFRPYFGKITDRKGRKLMLQVGAFLFLLSSALYGPASSVTGLILVRILHGTGIAAFTTASIAMIADMSPTGRRGEAFGAFGMAAMIALSGAPAAGTWVLDHSSFREMFLLTVGLSGISFGLCLTVKETLDHPREVQSGSLEGTYLPSATIMLCTITFGAIVAFLPFFAGEIPDFGLYYTGYALASVAVRLPLGKVSDRVGHRKVILPGMIVLSVALGLLSESRSLWMLVVSGVLYGVGFSSVYPSLTALLVERVHDEARARGLAWFTASFDLGITVGSFAFGFVPLGMIYPVGALTVLGGAGLFLAVEFLKVPQQ